MSRLYIVINQSINHPYLIFPFKKSYKLQEFAPKSPNQLNKEKIRILNQLHQKNPSKEVLIKVGIGKTVNILRRGFEESEGEERNLKKLSLKVYKKWKNELERKVELKSNPIDVQCDKVGQSIQKLARS